jgi:hypothetical protein
MSPETEYDDQDRAEVLDETNLTDDGEDIANFDDIEDVLDVTQVEGDSDEDEEDLDDLAEIDDELEAERDDEGLDDEREPLDVISQDDDAISDDLDQPVDFEAQGSRRTIADAPLNAAGLGA